MVDLPWSPRTRQQEGRQAEKNTVQERGGRVHPMSGAGSIKDDGSTDDELIEVKQVKRSHTMQGRDLNTLFRRATEQGKEAVYIVHYIDNNITAEVRLRRGN
jgi:hypothetical protein